MTTLYAGVWVHVRPVGAGEAGGSPDMLPVMWIKHFRAVGVFERQSVLPAGKEVPSVGPWSLSSKPLRAPGCKFLIRPPSASGSCTKPSQCEMQSLRRASRPAAHLSHRGSEGGHTTTLQRSAYLRYVWLWNSPLQTRSEPGGWVIPTYLGK
ncbi:hypothetical protein LZ30DRAFT_201027 [Colletotrichum cereale]|nr:hypothetical protein LZ30DRAFT_201027 [Colletotrichum cereale]